MFQCDARVEQDVGENEFLEIHSDLHPMEGFLGKILLWQQFLLKKYLLMCNEDDINPFQGCVRGMIYHMKFCRSSASTHDGSWSINQKEKQHHNHGKFHLKPVCTESPGPKEHDCHNNLILDSP